MIDSTGSSSFNADKINIELLFLRNTDKNFTKQLFRESLILLNAKLIAIVINFVKIPN